MKTDIEILIEKWNDKYTSQKYETNHLHYNYEDLVLKAMEAARADERELMNEDLNTLLDNKTEVARIESNLNEMFWPGMNAEDFDKARKAFISAISFFVTRKERMKPLSHEEIKGRVKRILTKKGYDFFSEWFGDNELALMDDIIEAAKEICQLSRPDVSKAIEALEKCITQFSGITGYGNDEDIEAINKAKEALTQLKGNH